MDKDREEKLVAACWTMYAAILIADSKDRYGSFAPLKKIAIEAMIRCGQIEKEE